MAKPIFHLNFLFLGTCFNSLINRFKALTFGLIAAFICTTIVWVDYIGLIIFVAHGDSIYLRMLKESPFSFFYIILISLIFAISCIVYGSYYLPGNHGKLWSFNQSNGNNKVRDFLIIFACVTILLALLTGYSIIAFAIIYGIFLTATLSAVFVDALYAAYYVRKHPESEQLH